MQADNASNMAFLGIQSRYLTVSEKTHFGCVGQKKTVHENLREIFRHEKCHPASWMSNVTSQQY